MKCGIREKLFWSAFKSGLRRELTNTLRLENSGEIMKKAYKKYKELLATAQDPCNRFTFNVIFAAMYGAVYLSLDPKPSVDEMTAYARETAMNNKLFLKFITSEENYTEKGQKRLAENAHKSQSDNNPCSWRYTFEPGKTLNEYTTKFTSCGILYLFTKWGISEITPALCRMDYDMAHAANTEFIREQTLAGGGEYCDCHYIHTPKKGK
ncbi:MAG: L-2-amino-thiazoline-4-carboxylic acid hydrolase [Firmicutes bacterium]|nr:L-2-amino-thiazoline-4-carboxylic acid hydrolase [Bacillota bacterium]